MRASTMFALIVAALTGLGAMASAKYMGLLEAKTAPVVEPATPTMVLVANRNLLEGELLQESDVRVRAIRKDEEVLLSKSPLPAFVQAVLNRKMKRNIDTDQMLLEEDCLLEKVTLESRITPGMRAVNLWVSLDNAAGGNIDVDQYVDIQLTTCIGLSDGLTGTSIGTGTNVPGRPSDEPNPRNRDETLDEIFRRFPSYSGRRADIVREGTGPGVYTGEYGPAITGYSLNTGSGSSTGDSPTCRTATVVREARVLARRDSLWPVNRPFRSDTMTAFTVECNPYRAALLEYAKDKGVVAIIPISSREPRVQELRAVHGRMRSGQENPGNVNYVIPNSLEYDDKENTRVKATLAGHLAVGEADLARVFGVTVSPVYSSGRRVVQRVSGIGFVEPQTFPISAESTPQPPPGNESQSRYNIGGPTNAVLNFGYPSGGGTGITPPGAKCVNCPKTNE